MSEGPAKSARTRFSLGCIFILVAEICFALAGLRLLSGDERVNLLIAFAIMTVGYGTFLFARWLYRILRSSF